MGGGLESRCVCRVYGADGAVQGTIRTVHTTYTAAFKTTVHPQTRYRNITTENTYPNHPTVNIDGVDMWLLEENISVS